MDIPNKFVFFNPFLTFFERDEKRFISLTGKLQQELDVDTAELFNLAREAFELLDIETEEQFNSLIHNWHEALLSVKDQMKQGYEAGFLQTLKIIPSEQNNYDWDRIDVETLLDINWKLYQTIDLKHYVFDYDIASAYALFSLFMIDDALLSLSLSNPGAIVLTIQAAKAQTRAIEIKANLQRYKQSKKASARWAGKLRSKNDLRTKEKHFICECWKAWQRNKANYKSKAEFARDMLSKVEHLKSQKKIEDWCREWEKSVTQRPR